MANKFYPKSNLPIRRSVELLPVIFQTDTNDKFLSGVVDPLIQPGVLDKVVGYIGRRYGKTYNANDTYVDTDQTLRSRYQLEPGIVYKNQDNIENFYDYIDFKNQLRFFGNLDERDDKITSQQHYSWNPPIDWDKFINYREYYWEPSGPPSIPVFGQTASVVSSYKVALSSTANSFIFTPDAFTNNPTLTLYRGQTYKFKVDVPGENFFIRISYDTGSLIYNENNSYVGGQLTIYDNKIYRAKTDISPLADKPNVSNDWEFIGTATSTSALDYNKGVTNNGIENGTLTFTVPYDAPDILFYQGAIDPNRLGRFTIADIESNTSINVEKEIIGKSTYLSSNGIEFTNGLVVEFRGNVTPSKYSQDTWLVEGVGKEITLTRFSDLIVPVLTTDVPEVLFDNEGFDSQPFDDATSYPTFKDYITIARNSVDKNPWSRYNRWFHRSVLEYAYKYRDQDFTATESARAKRPIIEFNSNLQLINHGSIAKETVDYIDDFTDDVFSNIEGSSGYNVDGEFLFEGARLLVVADKDSLSNNKIYRVTFIVHNGNRQIHLIETADAESILGQGILIRRGLINGGTMYHYNGKSWVKSQEKTSVNQPPLFDVFDENEISFSNLETYPVSTFTGSKLLSYKIGNGRVDGELGFPLSYLNINNVGDIQFDWNWEVDTFFYTINQETFSKKISVGYYKFNPNDQFDNGWTETSNKFIQPIIDSIVVQNSTNQISLKTVKWEEITDQTLLIINFYLNGKKIDSQYVRNLGTFTFDRSFVKNDVISIKIITDLAPNEGYYQIPIGLEKNPLNSILDTFTLGQAIDHISTAVEFNTEIVGNVPGVSNLRDISNYQQHAVRFLKHSGLTPLAVSLLCDKTTNIVKSIQFVKKSYTDFKNNFLIKAIELPYNDNLINFVDDIIADLSKTKTYQSPFSDSDMIGCGAYTSLKYKVEDTGIKTFSLTEKFSLTELSRRAVYVYVNNQQLLNTQDYTFNSVFGFVTLLIDLNEGDEVEIREYVSTSFCHIPPTPTSMGLYKKYIPLKFIDDTYVEPREVIQGHDGSITFAFGDFRDDLLLELEYRIYNNIKQEYNSNIFDIDSIVGGYYGNGLYEKNQLDNIVNQEFLKWIQNTNINYTLNTYLDTENSFTYTYSNMTDPTGTQNLPGYWRGVYQWFYDTDRPHRCPWEILGFSEKPTWWENEYGPAPYTSNNLILWEDIRDGVIRQGPRAGRYARYARSSILKHLPVDGDGKLLSPLDSGLAQDFSLINNKGPFILGDIAPVEYAWRSSSEWPFAVIMAMCLMKPFEFITDSFDLSKTKLNKKNQTVNNQTNLFSTISDITIPQETTDLSVGLVKYLVSYVKSRGINVGSIEEKISNLDVLLSSRLSGFVDQDQQKYLLDSKSPNSTTSSIFVPPENYDIIFNISSPISFVSYSGVVLEKTEGGWIVSGYDDIQPYFNYFSAMPNQRDPLISVGGVSETFVEWSENKIFNNGTLVRQSNIFYRALKTHNSGNSFDESQWQKLPGIPKVGAVEAFKRRTFNTLSVKKLSYGIRLTNIQQVVDFLLGYEEYLKSQGFVFDNYDPENQVSQDWTTSCKEFMFWTKHNWATGSLITLSPAAQKINVFNAVGVVDNILDGFYDYQVLRSDGKPLDPEFINVNRNFQNITVETVNTVEGIFYLKLYYVLKEHVAVFDDRTVFNDIIYDKTTGYRQERIKTQGFRTTDWDGDYTSPGFLFDNVNIQTWQPFKDYKLGDIVAYKSYNWTSLKNQLGTETFNDSNWTKLDSTPTKRLVTNFDYKIREISDFYEVASDGISESQRALARHAIGYQTRDYLQNLSEDPITQFQLYQGFIREKGTANSITKVFGKLSRSNTDSINLNEEWAFRTGKFGGIDQLKEIEIEISKNNFEIDPQSIVIESQIPTIKTDQIYRIDESNFTIKPIPYTPDVNPTVINNEITFVSGYVKSDQIDIIIKNKQELTSLDITLVKENNHIWITFDNADWSVFRINENPTLVISEFERTSDTTVTLTLNRPHSLVVNEYIGIRSIKNLTGFFKIIEVTNQTIILEIPADSQDPEGDISTNIKLQILTPCRFAKYPEPSLEAQREQELALLKQGSKLFIDNNGDNLWEVVEKQKQYSSKKISDYGIASPIGTGSKVIYDNNLKHIITSIPESGYVMCYVENATGLILKQIINPPVGFTSRLMNSFGQKMAVSPDGRYLIIASPLATDVPSDYRGDWNATIQYSANDIVLYAGRLWQAKNSNFADGSTQLAINSDDWELLTTTIAAYNDARGEGYYQQGMVSVYEFISGKYELTSSFVSPRPADSEKFGSEISIGLDNGTYYLAISAVGSYNNTGRVYLFSNSGAGWNNLENSRFRGEYNPLESYLIGDVVWQAAQDPIAEGVKGNLWQAVSNQLGDGSTITVDSLNWIKVSEISTHSSLPTNIALEDDGSTLEQNDFVVTGILSNNQLAEIIKEGDQFGYGLAMSRDARTLIVGAPYSDGQYFRNYRGVWRSDVEYIEGEVVKKEDGNSGAYIYYRLEDTILGIDSTLRSYNEDPSDSNNWVEISDSTTDPSGKVFVYQKNNNGYYELKQMINAGSLSDFSNLESGIIISSGDEFGFSLDIDSTGNTFVISSPKANINLQDQGAVYIFENDGTEYRLTQKLQSFEIYPDEFFGYSVSISPESSKIVVGARNTPTKLNVQFDFLQSTTFDSNRTSFYSSQGYTGAVYVFDKKDQTYFLTEKLDENLSPEESFGYSVDCVGSIILVGSPRYREPQPHNEIISFDGPFIGNVRLFKKSNNLSSWNILGQQQATVDITKIQSIELYDNIKNVKIQDVDYIDPAKGKILNVAEQEIKFKTPYDPAIYTIGTEDVVVDSSINWLEKNVGSLWWNLSTAKWVYYEQGDLAYRKGNWNQLAVGASIDIYEWVETPLLPSEWAALADTNEGIAEGISGQPLYPNDDVYSVKQFFSESTGQVSQTLYYYWVKNKTIVPINMPSRKTSAAEVAQLILNPAGSNLAFIAFIDSNKFIAYNFKSLMPSDTALLNVQYRKNLKSLNQIHNEYQLLTEGVADSLPSIKLENKWIDSLIGTDIQGNTIPDPKLPAKQKYGIEYRPRQSMFINRTPILRTVIENINTVLKKEAFADTINFENLNLVDESPNPILNLFDSTVDTLVDLQTVGTVRVKQAKLRANIVDGELDTIDIIDPGFGYRVVPNIIFDGDGQGANAEIALDNQGRIISVNVVSRGKRYSNLLVTIRNFSVLVKNDSTVNNFWSIYAWDDVRRVFFRSQSQAFDTTRYWSLVDWWKNGYGITSRIVLETLSIEEALSYNLLIGDLLRIKEYSNGGWAVFEKVANTGETFLDQYQIVGREKGTIEFNRSLWDTTILGIGFDNTQSFDASSYDIDNSKELRNILRAVKENIFIGDYAVEWNKLFFSSIRYVFTEQQYVDWAFKTSFLNATHNVGSFEQKLNYRSDNLESYQEYINEVKPYRTTVREYISRYDTIEPYGSAVADFDLPATYSSTDGQIVSITQGRPELQQYPWKWWTDNNGYSVVDIQIYDSGENYTTVPKVLIEGTGIGASALAFISNGRVSGVKVINPGTGYISAPTITLVGGNPSDSRTAKAVAILGDTKVRTFDLTIKYDRISKEGIYINFDQTQEFIATGLTAVFDLNYAPTRDKTKISIIKNNQVVLPSEYTISLFYSSTDGYNLLKGRIVFSQAPATGDVIQIVYEKNDELLDSVNRIQKYYDPVSRMKGKELNQLMTGIDFGGVQIQGTTFDVTGGWDALPWFTDNWDSVESSADYYVIVDLPIIDGSTNAEDYTITLPFTPADGQQITVYLKRISEPVARDIATLGPNTSPKVVLTEGSTGVTTVRIDDPNYTDVWDSSIVTNPNAQMPTIIGDGSTRIINIGKYIQLRDEDILIFRPIESDGAVTITDPNLLDTQISGGTLASMSGAYLTATGATVEEISITGGKFIEPDHVPAPEENIPGQVLEGVSIKVFQSSVSGAAPLQSKIKKSNGTDLIYAIGQKITENNSVIVYVNKVKKELGVDYTLDLADYNVEFITAPPVNAIVEVLSIGIGGLELIDYQEFIADGDTNLFLTAANYADTSNVFVTINGNYIDVGFINSTDVIDTTEKTMVQFPFLPAAGDVIKIVCLKASLDVDSTGLSIVKVNNQTFEFEGSTRSFDISNFVELTRGSARNSMIVEVNGRILKASDTTYAVYNGTNNSFTLGQDPLEPAGSILPSNIRVFINNIEITFITDYVFDGTTKVLTILPARLTDGDVIRIQNSLKAEYSINNNTLIIDSSVDLTSTNETDNDIIEITWFTEYPSLDIISDEYTGGKINYKLSRQPLSASYVWVYKNGQRLTQDVDFYVTLPRSVVYLTASSTQDDEIRIIQFGSTIYRLPSAYEIHKDMLNFYHFKRFSKGTIKLTKVLNYYDTSIEVNDASSLTEPISSRNIPGIVYINGEKIEYMNKVGNILSQLRRGCFGTAIGESYDVGSDVVDAGSKETIPYNETQDREDFVSDGSTLLIGPLSFIPAQGTRNSWYKESIPITHGPCDEIEVFAAGRRLRKDPIAVYQEEKGATSPGADIVIEAEFSVDGLNAYIRLTEPIPAGTRITVIKRTGKTWYERGDTTASKGITLIENNTAIAKFIAQKTTSLPE